MAAPKKNTTKPDDPRQRRTREAIKTSQLVNRLQGFALNQADGKTGDPIEIDGHRLKAIEILLRKSLPDLSSVQLTGDEDNPVHVKSSNADIEAVLGHLAAIAERNRDAG